jgi:hypothetical protein
MQRSNVRYDLFEAVGLATHFAERDVALGEAAVEVELDGTLAVSGETSCGSLRGQCFRDFHASSPVSSGSNSSSSPAADSWRISGHAPGEATLQRARSVLTEAGSTLTASMLRDLQRGHAIEADHVVGDMLARAGQPQDDRSLLAVVYAHLKTYEADRARAT